jgi:type I restriction enzyme S subunit
MTGEWPILSLREAGVSLIDCDHKTPPPADTGYPYIAIPQVKLGRIDLTDVRLISREHFIEWTRKANPQPYDVILSRRCNPGETAFVPPSLECALGQNLVLLRADSERVFPQFLRWLVSGPAWWEQIGKFINVGAVFDSLRCADIPNFELAIPTLSEQRAIAHILGTLDDKIELNRKMNQTLEAMARAVFKSWFVDFDPVRAKAEGRDPGLPRDLAALFPDSFEDSELGEIPKGWEIKTVADLAELNSWTLSKSDDLDRIEYVEISEVSRGDIGTIQVFLRGQEPSRARRRLRHGDTVLSTVRPDRGSYFLYLQPTENLVASTGFAVFTPMKAPWSLIHATLTQPELFEQLGHLADGGAYPAIRPEVIGQQQLLWPDKTAITDAFHGICGPLYEKAEQNRRESRTLAALRDALLPKLLSGEIRTYEADQRTSR